MSSTPSSTPAATPSNAPGDLVPIRDAARLVGRGLSTVRAWCASGELTAYHGAGTHPGNRPVLVSRAELLILAATSKSPTPGRAPPPVATMAPAVEAAELATVRAELATARAERDLVRAELAARADVVDALRLVIRATEDRARDLATALEAERARTVGLSAELNALRGDAGLPWWRRLLGVSSTPRLPGNGEA